MTEILALIPARGGSQSIPRKNLVQLAGKPLIGYSIEQARRSKLITRTIVSTDDDEIAEVALGFGAEVPFRRPKEFATNESLDLDVFRHALKWLQEEEGYTCDVVVHLRPTGPARRVETIDSAIRMFLDHPEADSLRSVSPPDQTPYKMWSKKGDYLEPLLTIDGVSEPHSLPRQLLPTVYWHNGLIDIVRPHVILDQDLMCGDKVLAFFMDEPVLDLDYEEDLPRVEEALIHLEKELKKLAE